MSIIREIKAAFRWVFNIKDEVKQDQEQTPDIKPGDLFATLGGRKSIVHVLRVYEKDVIYRYRGTINTCLITKEQFFLRFGKLS